MVLSEFSGTLLCFRTERAGRREPVAVVVGGRQTAVPYVAAQHRPCEKHLGVEGRKLETRQR